MVDMNFVEPACIKALVVPAGSLKAQEFHKYYDRLCQASQVPLIDVHLPKESRNRDADAASQQPEAPIFNTNNPHSMSKDQRMIFDPSVNPMGRVMYSFETSSSDQLQKALGDLEPWRQQFLVFGIAYSEICTDQLKSYLADLRKLYSSSLYHVILVFGVTSISEDWPEDIYPILSSKVTSLESTISTVTGNFLAQLSIFWITRQLHSFQSPSVILNQQGRRANQPTSPSTVKLSRTGSISGSITERAKSRQEGRTRKFLGSLYLLSGRITDALAELGASVTIMKESGDHLWYGTALSEIALCLVILKYDKVPCLVPSGAVSAAWAVALKQMKKHTQRTANLGGVGGATVVSGTGVSPGVNSKEMSPQPSHHIPRSSSETGSISNLSTDGSPKSPPHIFRVASLRKSKPFTEQTPLEDIMEFIICAAIEEFIQGNGTETVPYTVYCETIVRYVNFLIDLRYGGGWTSKALGSVLQGCPLSSGSGNFPSIFTIERWIVKVYDLSLKNLEPDTQVLVLGAVAALYSRAGLERKWAFTCVQIVSLLASSSATVHTDLGHLEDILKVYTIWPKLQAQILRKLVALGQRIKNPKLQTEAAIRLLAMACFTENDMMDKEQLTMYHLIRSYGDVVQSQFWDPEIVRSVSIKTRRLKTVRSSKTNKSEIIYNPFEGTDSKDEESIEAGVPTTAKIFLRNPLAIEIQLYELVLVDSQKNKVSKTAGELVIPPKTQKFKVEVPVIPPSDESNLEVIGCEIQVQGCTRCVHPIPAISIPISPARPVLALEELSLSKGWTMILEGEIKKFSITLWNGSQTPSEVLHFGFNDSTVNPAKAAASNHEISRTELYEYEYFLYKRRAIHFCDTTKDLRLPPQTSQKFNFELFGKRGANSASVLVDYGLNEDSLRRLKIPLQITIYPSILIERVNILPCTKSECVLLILDLRNSWREQLTCRIWADGGEVVEHHIESLSSRRYLVNVPWDAVSADELRKPIPSLTNKQYTVDTRTSADQLEIFWLREKFISKLHGEWSNDRDRSGFIELRAIKLNRRMADVLKVSSIEVCGKPMYKGKVDEPLKIGITVVNKSTDQVQGMLRVIPNKSAQRYMLSLGTLQQLVTLKPGENIKVNFEVLFLNQGPYELSSTIDPIPGSSIKEVIFQNCQTVVHIDD